MTADGTERAVVAVIAASGADAFEILRGRVVPLDLLAALWAEIQIVFLDIFLRKCSATGACVIFILFAIVGNIAATVGTEYSVLRDAFSTFRADVHCRNQLRAANSTEFTAVGNGFLAGRTVQLIVSRRFCVRCGVA